MSDYTFNPKYITKDDDTVVNLIVSKIKALGSFSGIGLEKTYLVKYIGSSTIRYVGKERSKGKPEEMSFDDIRNTFRILRTLSVFNTNTEILKEKFPSPMYRLRAQLFAILLETGVIIPV